MIQPIAGLRKRARMLGQPVLSPKMDLSALPATRTTQTGQEMSRLCWPFFGNCAGPQAITSGLKISVSFKSSSPKRSSHMFKSPMYTCWDWPFTKVASWHRSINEYQLTLFAVVAKPLNSSSRSNHPSLSLRRARFVVFRILRSGFRICFEIRASDLNHGASFTFGGLQVPSSIASFGQ